jgi:hypothetical protein
MCEESGMVQKQKIRVLLVVGLFFISLGGWLLHMRIHPISKLALNWVPFVAGLISVTAAFGMAYQFRCANSVVKN